MNFPENLLRQSDPMHHLALPISFLSIHLNSLYFFRDSLDYRCLYPTHTFFSDQNLNITCHPPPPAWPGLAFNSSHINTQTLNSRCLTFKNLSHDGHFFANKQPTLVNFCKQLSNAANIYLAQVWNFNMWTSSVLFHNNNLKLIATSP